MSDTNALDHHLGTARKGALALATQTRAVKMQGKGSGLAKAMEKQCRTAFSGSAAKPESGGVV